MNWCPTPPVKKVRDALALHGRGVTETGPGEWQMELQNGRPFPVRAWVRGPWLTLEAGCTANGTDLDPWQILLEAGEVSGGGRTVMDPRTGEVRFRSEVFLHAEAPLPEGIGAACSGLVQVMAHPEAGASLQNEPGPFSTKPLCERVGETLTMDAWDWEERDDGSISVSLEESTGSRCRVTPGPHGGLVARVEIYTGPTGSPGLRRAQGILLLTGAGPVRLIQGYAREDPGVDRVGLRVALRGDPAASELTQGLSALSLGTSRLRDTAGALSDPSVAERYIRLRGREAWTAREAWAGRQALRGNGKKGRNRRSRVEPAYTKGQGGEV